MEPIGTRWFRPESVLGSTSTETTRLEKTQQTAANAENLADLFVCLQRHSGSLALNGWEWKQIGYLMKTALRWNETAMKTQPKKLQLGYENKF